MFERYHHYLSASLLQFYPRMRRWVKQNQKQEPWVVTQTMQLIVVQGILRGRDRPPQASRSSDRWGRGGGIIFSVRTCSRALAVCNLTRTNIQASEELHVGSGQRRTTVERARCWGVEALERQEVRHSPTSDEERQDLKAVRKSHL